MCVGIGEAQWSFKTEFDVTEDELAAPNADLVFDGLDTFASVILVRSYDPRDIRITTYISRFGVWTRRMTRKSSSKKVTSRRS